MKFKSSLIILGLVHAPVPGEAPQNQQLVIYGEAGLLDPLARGAFDALSNVLEDGGGLISSKACHSLTSDILSIFFYLFI